MGRGTRKKNKDRTDFSHLMVDPNEENNNDNEIDSDNEKKEDE